MTETDKRGLKIWLAIVVCSLSFIAFIKITFPKEPSTGGSSYDRSKDWVRDYKEEKQRRQDLRDLQDAARKYGR